MVNTVEVRIWGKLAGAAIWDPQTQTASFEYAPSFLPKGYDLSPIQMPLRQGARVYRFPELRNDKNNPVDTFQGLPGLLADALPDRYGNQLIDAWLAQNGRPPNSMNPVEKLCFIGSRGMGALEFEPSKLTKGKRTFSVELDSLVSSAKQLLEQRENFQTDLNTEMGTHEILKIGTSAGGARPKAIIAFNPKTKEVRSGQTAVPKGFEHWLLKLDGVNDAQFGASHGYGRVEYAYYLMAKDCGIDMMESQLLEENGRAHFLTKRFDREGAETKHHIQTLCGLRHFNYNNLYSYGYEQIFETMRMLRLTYPEAEQMFRRMVFNVLATNCDDHTKNFSFRLKQGGKWELAPAYDVCYAYDPTNIWVSQQSLSINGKHRDITTADFEAIAKANSIRKPKEIIEEVKAVVLKWKKYAAEAEVPKPLSDTIWTHLAARRL